MPHEYQHKARVTTSLGALIKAIQDVSQPYKETQVVQMTVQILLRHAHGVIIAHDANGDDVSIEN